MARNTLESIGKAWFVVYKYYEVVDQTMTAWDNVGHDTRLSSYDSNRNRHHEWLEDIMKNSLSSVGRGNSMGLPQSKIRKMAEELHRRGI